MTVSLNPTIQLGHAPAYTSSGENLSPKEVAQEFESLFLAQLLTIMQESADSSDLFEGGPGKEIYMSMMNQEMGRALAAGGGVGLSKLIEPYLSRQTGLPSSAGVNPATSGPETSIGNSENPNELSGFSVSSRMGWRNDPLTGEWRYHRGVDYAAPHGTDVRSLSGGQVVFADRQGGYGNTVVVESESGVRTRYAHLSELGVTKGEEVSRGQEIGKVGDSGRATGPHLHLEVERAGRLLDPLSVGTHL